ncbi:MAG TPA: DapH/DapD/GlmU-related protein [Solirubrobacteraceae bacterium]|nr:DapH/DapD/GlmU-related protein [Solirubrobacteraceae bacterium]
MNNLPLHLQRLTHRLHLCGWSRLARALTHLNAFLFHAVLPPEATLPRDLRLHHHALGIVIHPRVEIGQRVNIHHNVTLGTDVPNDSGLMMRIGDDVSIGAGAVLLGPITVGDGARVGAGAVVTRDVAARTTVAGNPARTLLAGVPHEASPLP